MNLVITYLCLNCGHKTYTWSSHLPVYCLNCGSTNVKQETQMFDIWKSLTESRPKIICLCGSTKFKKEFEEVEKDLTLKGNIILTCGLFGHADSWNLDVNTKQMLDELHLRKIDLADEIFVINVNGYIGESTQKEIDYANEHSKIIRFLELIPKYPEPPLLDERYHFDGDILQWDVPRDEERLFQDKYKIYLLLDLDKKPHSWVYTDCFGSIHYKHV